MQKKSALAQPPAMQTVGRLSLGPAHILHPIIILPQGSDLAVVFRQDGRPYHPEKSNPCRTPDASWDTASPAANIAVANPASRR